MCMDVHFVCNLLRRSEVLNLLQVKRNRNLDARLYDICIGTTAAPTYLPAHYFDTKCSKGSSREFHLVDGGVAANNPVRAPPESFDIHPRRNY